jgi:hypothetical protein
MQNEPPGQQYQRLLSLEVFLFFGEGDEKKEKNI